MIGYFVLVSVIQILVFSVFTNGQQHKTVEVEVYYEALCPDAKKFMVTQLGPFLKEDLSRYMNLTLIPYGKAQTVQNYEFKCDHGEVECYGNKFHACALGLLNFGSNSPNFVFNKEAAEYAVCLMKDLSSSSSKAQVDEASEKCTSPNNHNLLKNCTNDKLGQQSFANMGVLTDHFQKPLLRVPTIVFRRSFRKKESIQAQNNFKEAFCSKIESEEITACPQKMDPSTTQIPEVSTGPTILPIPQLSLGITIWMFLGIRLFYI